MFQHLPHVVLEVQLLQLLAQLVYELLVSTDSHYFYVSLCSYHKIHPLDVQHEHLSLDLIVVIVVWIQVYLPILPLQIEICWAIDDFVQLHVLLRVRTLNFYGSQQFALLVHNETVWRCTEPRSTCPNSES